MTDDRMNYHDRANKFKHRRVRLLKRCGRCQNGRVPRTARFGFGLKSTCGPKIIALGFGITVIERIANANLVRWNSRLRNRRESIYDAELEIFDTRKQDYASNQETKNECKTVSTACIVFFREGTFVFFPIWLSGMSEKFKEQGGPKFGVHNQNSMLHNTSERHSLICVRATGEIRSEIFFFANSQQCRH